MRLLDKLELHQELIASYEELMCEDAVVVITAIGITARAASRAVKNLRAQGIKAGMFRPITLWPFPEKQFKQAVSNSKAVLVAEMNAGQLVLEVERLCAGKPSVHRLNRIGGEVITPAEIEQAIKEVLA
jgi:2-oxoglutarate ferredoxin oxidoreductase subunit alpha